MRAMYPCLSLVAFLTLLLFASEPAVAVPNCSQVDTGFCLNPDPVNCTVSLEWRGSCGNGDRQWRCVWSGPECEDAGNSEWIDCTCNGVGCDCLVAGTLIAMADGTEKPIEALQVGDMVMTYIEVEGATAIGQVERVHTPYLVGSYILVTGKIGMTENHPVLRDGEWAGAGTLEVGDKLVAINGFDLEITSVERIMKAVKVYNVQVSTHTYIADGVVVHNKEDCEEYMQAP